LYFYCISLASKTGVEEVAGRLHDPKILPKSALSRIRNLSVRSIILEVIMEDAFKEFIKENWPGFSHPQVQMDPIDRAEKLENLKEAFKAGWEAGMDKALADYV